MKKQNRRGARLAFAATSTTALLATVAGTMPALAAPAESRAQGQAQGQGRAAQAEKAQRAIQNGSGKATKVAPVDGPWMNTRLTADQRADLLLAKMTLEEKISRLHGEFSGETAFYIAPLARLGIPALLFTDAGGGVRVTNPATNDGRATALPAPIALGATWDAALARQYGDVLGVETRATGQNGLLGPTGDLVRDPRWGRQFESLGEDPRLASTLLAEQIEAVQAHDVVATVKHPAAYTQESDRLNGGDIVVSERALREVYMAPVEAAVDAGVGSAMCSFNKVNGVYACESSEVLQEILKDGFGFKGFVQTDYGAAHSTVASANNGLDVEFPAGNYFSEGALKSALGSGQVSIATLDEKVHRILRTMFAFGIFEHAVAVTALPEARDAAIAQTVAENAAVLLKNTAATAGAGAVLPLKTSSLDSIAVIGADADALATGGGSSVVKPTSVSTPLDAITARVGSGVTVRYEAGTDPVGPAHVLSGAAVPSSVLAPAGAPSARGLKAEYFFSHDLTGQPAVTRTDAQVALNGGFLSLDGLYASSVPKVPGFNFGGPLSARWTGTITAPATGDYRLAATGFGSARVWLDGELVIDASDPHALRTDTSPSLALTAGTAHDLRVEYRNDFGDNTQESAADLVLTWQHPQDVVTPEVQEAVAAAKASDVAVVFARDYVAEGRDKRTLTLANEQDALIDAVSEANPRTVVVLTTSGSVTMPWLDAVPSVLQAWYGGQEQGTAIARVLFGDVNPSGKLPVTFAASDTATPTASPAQFPGIDRVATVSEGVNIGYRGYAAAGIRPLFSFGHGLSYTSFGYSQLRLTTTGQPVRNGGTAQVTATVKVQNTGSTAGKETVQVYVGALPTTAVSTPPKQLAGFAKVDLAPGQSKNVQIALDPRAFSYWDERADRWVTPTGDVAVSVGTSSSDTRLQGTVSIR